MYEIDMTMKIPNTLFSMLQGCDKNALVWDIRTGQVINTFDNHNADINCVRLVFLVEFSIRRYPINFVQHMRYMFWYMSYHYRFYPGGDTFGTASDDGKVDLIILLVL
jgi:WD40 repeat protein